MPQTKWSVNVFWLVPCKYKVQNALNLLHGKNLKAGGITALQQMLAFSPTNYLLSPESTFEELWIFWSNKISITSTIINYHHLSSRMLFLD